MAPPRGRAKSRPPPDAKSVWARVRLYIAGEVVDDATLVIGSPERVADVFAVLGERHGQYAAAAADAGASYMVDFEFADGEHVRWGTDPDGMVEPVPVDDVLAAIEARWR
jgi:hypothetical protein